MDSPAKRYKTLLNINNIKDIAYDTLFTKYIIQNLKGDAKRLELDTTDQESLMRKFNGGYPLPGFIYTFIYPPSPEDNVKIIDKGKEREYVDFVPLVFCTTLEGKNFRGINLNVLPNIERVKFLETYWSGYKSFFENIEIQTENDKLALNKAYIYQATGERGAEIIKIFSKMATANFGYGYRTYNMMRIKQLRMIEYTEWEYIPHYDPRNAFKKMNQKQIHDLYYKSL